jgi:hypothetical protein
MAMNVLNVWGEIFGIVGGALILIVFCVTFYPLVTRYRVPPPRLDDEGSTEGNPDNQTRGVLPEGKIRPQDYIDSINGEVNSGRGVIPLVVSIFSIGLLLWWLIYLVTNWSQYLWSVRSFWR